jgi:Pentapeptide repeats (8 copies)
MDRDEALKLLMGGTEGIAEWNQRREFFQEHTDLSGVDLSGPILAADAISPNLNGAKLNGADLSQAHLERADLIEASLGDRQAASEATFWRHLIPVGCKAPAPRFGTAAPPTTCDSLTIRFSSRIRRQCPRCSHRRRSRISSADKDCYYEMPDRPRAETNA